MQVYKTKSPEETQKIAEFFASKFKSGGVVALSGELGAGKTTFVQGFAKGLGVQGKIISPTFLIIRQYPIPDQKNFFYHIDLYRIEKVKLEDLGLKEILTDPGNIVVIEWPERIIDFSDYNLKINIESGNESLRNILVSR
jgi:tRNA threonylcarbamoyladenosine biosynthesis protein TsaE